MTGETQLTNEIIEVQPQQVAASTQTSNGSSTIINAIAQAATNPDVDVEKMERLWAMHEKMAARDAEQSFNDAMTKAQADMGRISADAQNPQTRSQYASYAQMDRCLRPVYTSNGFSLSFNTGESARDDCIRVFCYVSHNAGHTRTYSVDMPADGKGAKGGDVMTKTHASGSAMSYGMRYLLKLIFNVAIGEDDDDGNGADGSGVSKLSESGRDAAMQGTQALTDWWKRLSQRDQKAMNKEFGALRAAARRVDEGAQ